MLKTGVTDYNNYIMTGQEKARYMVMAAIFMFILGYVFFSSFIIALAFCCGAFFYLKYKSRDLIKRRKSELRLQFKDALYSLSSALGVGRSLESSFRMALNDLRFLYPEPDSDIIREFELICRRIDVNEPVENALLNFASRSGLEDIRNFAEVIVICKRTGGDMVQVIKNAANIISEKIEISQDIDLVLTRQKYEQKVLNIMPVVFIGLIKFCGSGYMDLLYSSVKGYILMAVAMFILAAAYAVSKKITDIGV